MSDVRTPGTQDQQTSTDDEQGAGRLRGKVAIITGGASDIGRATAVLLAREGASLTLVYGPEQQHDAEVTADLVGNAGQRCQLCPGDVNDPARCDQVVAVTLERYGRLDILVNTAACPEHRQGTADEQSDRRFRTTIHAYLHMTRAAVPYMGNGGAIINVGSEGLEAAPHALDHAANRGAMHAFTSSLAQNLAPEGIRVTDASCASGEVLSLLHPHMTAA